MNTNQLMNDILAVLKMIQEDKPKLEKLHEFMMEEIYEEPEPEEIPEKYKKAVHEIADSLQAGFVCYLNPETLEVEDLPETMVHDPTEYEMITGESYEDAEIKHNSWDKCIEVEPMDSHEAFQIMEYFIDEIDDRNLQERVIKALNKPRPFARFKDLVEYSDYRQQWFDFRMKQYELYVWNDIQMHFESEE